MWSLYSCDSVHYVESLFLLVSALCEVFILVSQCFLWSLYSCESVHYVESLFL